MNYSCIHDDVYSLCKICKPKFMSKEIEKVVVIVLAGTYQQFKDFKSCHSMPGDFTKYVFAGSPHHIAGIRADKVVTFGSFWDRTDAFKLNEFAQTRLKHF